MHNSAKSFKLCIWCWASPGNNQLATLQCISINASYLIPQLEIVKCAPQVCTSVW